jgi:hypothetical protein
MEKAARLPGLNFHRCHGCGFRFGTLGASCLHLKDIAGVFRKGLFGTVAVAAALLVLTVVLWLAGRQATFSPD